MKTIIERPILATIFFILVIVLGGYSLKNTPIELVPDADEGLPSLNVNYQWRGASPDIILQKVLIPAEREILDIKGVTKIKTRATQNRGTIEVEFSRNTKMNFATVNLSEGLNRLQKTLPRRVQNFEILPYIPNEFKKEPAFEFGVHGNISIYALKKIVDKEIHPYIKSIEGIKSVEIRGGVEPEIKIRTNMDRLKRFWVTVNTIRQKINNYFFSKKSITVTRSASEITLSLSENPDKILDLQNIVLMKNGNQRVLLKDVAEVFLGYQELMFENRFNGMPNIGFQIYKEANYSSIKMAKKVREKLQYLANKLKGKVQFSIRRDESKDLRNRIFKLIKIAFLVLIIIFLILIFIVRDVKASLLIFSSVFFSVFTTFTVIYLLRIPLNLLTLSGLALGFGLFVDNAVVVFDSILRFREAGEDKLEAAVKGAKAVILPVFSSTLTTIIVFFSFALLFKDRLRVFYLPLAYIITIALLSSIIVSFVLIPSLSARLNLKVKKEKLITKKGKFFPFLLKYPLVILIPIVLTLALSYNTFKKEVSFGRFFSWSSNEYSIVWLRFPSGAEFKDIKEAILNFESVALAKPFKKEIDTWIYPGGAYMRIDYPDDIRNSALPIQLEQELTGVATNLAGVGVGVRGFSPEPYFYNPDTGSFLPYNIHIKGYNYEKLMKYAKEVKTTLLGHRRIKEVDIQTDMDFWWGGKEKYFAFKIDRRKIRSYNISPTYLLGLIYSVLRESSNTQPIKFDDKELYIEIKTSDVEDLELNDILNMNLPTIDGIPFRIKDVVNIEFSTQKGGITRENQEYIAMIMWDYLGSAKAGNRFHKTLFKNLELPPGFKKSLEVRKFRITEEEEGQLMWAMILSGLLIYLILGMLYENVFQPFLIMISIPLALTGVFIAFVIMDYSWDSTAWIGIILLAGIVVNNAILLIDNINRHFRKTSELIKSISIGTKERIRPIFMTTATTVLGMLPLIIFKKADSSDIWSSLALCTVGGLTTSAILILFVLPVFYYLFFRLQRFLTGSLKKPHDAKV